MCAVLDDLYSGKVVGWSMASVQDRHLVLKAVMIARWQRPDRSEVILHSDRGTQFTSAEYQQWPVIPNPVASRLSPHHLEQRQLLHLHEHALGGLEGGVFQVVAADGLGPV